MKKTKVLKKLLGGVNLLALMLVMQTANSACIWVAHQPEFPKEAEKYRNKKI
ncbi:MAG: cyclic lactone autoinducer peptide [Lachnospiraceae bacterium]|nr:cyclic lactone autoinducer peptide [Lachnospiraceae bacterium]